MFEEAIILIIALLFVGVNSQTYPNQNCPVFQYDKQNGFNVGRVELPNDFSGDYTISVNMTAVATVSENIKIQLQTDSSDIRKGFPLVYFIIFPIQNPLLKPTRIEFNRQVYCTGPQEPLTRGSVTNFWANHYFGTGGPIPRSPPGQPPVVLTPSPPNFQANPAYPSFTEPTIFTPPITIQNTPAVTQTTLMRLPPSVVPYSSDCGLDPTARVNPTQSSSIPLIADGKNVTDKQFPWMAAIMYVSTTNLFEYHCTGNLVSNKHVITAAHCVQVKKSPLVQKEDVVILLGVVDISNWVINPDITQAQVSDISVPPNFNSTNGDYDVAVFTLKRKIKFTPYVRPICIWNEDADLTLVEGEQGIAAGWGRDRSGNAEIKLAAYVEMPIVSQATCLRSNLKFRRQSSINTFCAGNRDGSGPCNGDSGGPFMLKRSGRWTLRGVVSRSLSDDENQCDVYNYFVFADLAKVRNWLDGVLI